MIKKTLSLCTLLFCFVSTFDQLSREAWVDSVFNALNTNRKIGQLFMLPVPTQGDAAALSEIRSKVKNEQVGGIILTGGNPLQLANQVADSRSKPIYRFLFRRMLRVVSV